ncbi:MAG: hypothetical protein ACFE85_09140 [Candidatus Hodarchaeota archaeon]
MVDHKNGKQNGYSYANKSLKKSIDNNDFVKNVRKKLMQERLKKNFSK